MKPVLLALSAIALCSAARADDAGLLADLRLDVRTLVGFKDRNACDAAPDAGVAQAQEWIKGRYGRGARLKVSGQSFAMGKDCPGKDVERQNVVAILEGDGLGSEAVVVGGHYDSIAFTHCQGWHEKNRKAPWIDAKGAPGANDSGSQTAVVLETAHWAAERRFRRTVVFVSFAGEEQGLDGSAAFVKDLARVLPGKKVVAMINLDIVGGDRSVNDAASSQRYRIFAPTQTIHQELAGKILELNAAAYPEFHADLFKTADRPHRGGDQESFQDAGIPAVRLIEARENTDHQHCSADLEKYVSPEYEARVARLVEAVVTGLTEKAD